MNNRAKKIYKNTLAIIQDIETKYKTNELSESSLKQRNNAISSSRRRINTPEITKSIMGPDETTIRNKLTDLFNVNNNPIIKLNDLAILLEKLNDFDNDYVHIYLILVWITLYILIDSKKQVLIHYEQYVSSDNSDNKTKVIEYLKNKKPFYRAIDYNQLLFLYKYYNSILNLQNMKIKRASGIIRKPTDFLINTSIVKPTITSIGLSIIGIEDKRKYGKIQKAIDKLRAKK